MYRSSVGFSSLPVVAFQSFLIQLELLRGRGVGVEVEGLGYTASLSWEQDGNNEAIQERLRGELEGRDCELG